MTIPDTPTTQGLSLWCFNIVHRGVSTPVVPRRRARMDHVGSASGVAHGHAIHQLEHHGQLRMMPGPQVRGVAAHTHTLTPNGLDPGGSGRRGSRYCYGALGRRCPGHRRPTGNTRALVFSVMVSSWFSFVFTCMHTHASHTHQAHPEANAHISTYWISQDSA